MTITYTNNTQQLISTLNGKTNLHFLGFYSVNDSRVSKLKYVPTVSKLNVLGDGNTKAHGSSHYMKNLHDRTVVAGSYPLSLVDDSVRPSDVDVFINSNNNIITGPASEVSKLGVKYLNNTRLSHVVPKDYQFVLQRSFKVVDNPNANVNMTVDEDYNVSDHFSNKHMYYASIVMNLFDLDCCKYSLLLSEDGNYFGLFTTESGHEAVKNKSFSLDSPRHCSRRTLDRIQKYEERGYTIHGKDDITLSWIQKDYENTNTTDNNDGDKNDDDYESSSRVISRRNDQEGCKEVACCLDRTNMARELFSRFGVCSGSLLKMLTRIKLPTNLNISEVTSLKEFLDMDKVVTSLYKPQDKETIENIRETVTGFVEYIMKNHNKDNREFVFYQIPYINKLIELSGADNTLITYRISHIFDSGRINRGEKLFGPRT